MSGVATTAVALLGTGGGPLAAGAEDLGEKALEHVVRHRLFETAFTNHMLMLVLSALLLALVVPVVARARAVVPRGAYNFLESILQFLREEVARPALGEHTDRFVPYIWSVFFLILTANLLGMVPIGPLAAPLFDLDARVAHIGGTATGNLSITAGLALCSLFLIHGSGMRTQGPGRYWKSFFFGHAPMWLAPLMIPLEIIGALVKPFALAVRLFANMIAGHIVIAVTLFFAAAGLRQAFDGAPGFLGITIASVLGALAISLLEIFVAFLQAYIFTFLTTLFVSMAVHTEH